MNDYQKREHDNHSALVTELNTISGLTFRLEASADHEFEDVRLEGETPIVARGKNYSNQYAFFLHYNLPYVRYDTYNTVAKKYEKPNEVGVLNKNKILSWVKYLEAIYKELQAISQERVKEVAEFEAEVLKNGATIGKKDPNYHTFEGQIVKNGVEFSFVVHDEGYISKKIDIHYTVRDTLEAFLKLSDNNYR